MYDRPPKAEVNILYVMAIAIRYVDQPGNEYFNI